MKLELFDINMLFFIFYVSPECRKHSPWSFLRIGSPEHLLFCLNPPYFSGHKVGRFLEKLYGAILRLCIVRLKRILHLLQLFSRTLQCCFAVKLQEFFVFKFLSLGEPLTCFPSYVLPLSQLIWNVLLAFDSEYTYLQKSMLLMG